MCKAFRFKNKGIKRLLDISRQYTEFRIPYEGDESTKKPTLWFVHDDGVYLMVSAKVPDKTYEEWLKTHQHVAYAEGHGRYTHLAGDDFVEEIELTEKLQKWIDAGQRYCN